MDKKELERIKKAWEYEEYQDVTDLINEVELLQRKVEVYEKELDRLYTARYREYEKVIN